MAYKGAGFRDLWLEGDPVHRGGKAWFVTGMKGGRREFNDSNLNSTTVVALDCHSNCCASTCFLMCSVRLLLSRLTKLPVFRLFLLLLDSCVTAHHW